MENQKPEFTGVWMPKYIIENKDLKPVDRLIYAEISCFDTCTMTNKTLGERAGCSEDTASRSVTRLKQGGYIKITGFNGRVRKMQSLHVMPPQNAEAASAKTPKLPPQNKSQDNSIENIQKTALSKDKGLMPEYGNQDINELMAYWHEILGYKITSRVKPNRNACNNLVKKYGVGGVKQLVVAVNAAQSDRYSPRISDFVTLQGKLNDLLAWAKNRSSNKSVGVKL
jgi:DNA-binding Lrp family transcriptional regulator